MGIYSVPFDSNDLQNGKRKISTFKNEEIVLTIIQFVQRHRFVVRCFNDSFVKDDYLMWCPLNCSCYVWNIMIKIIALWLAHNFFVLDKFMPFTGIFVFVLLFKLSICGFFHDVLKFDFLIF